MEGESKEKMRVEMRVRSCLARAGRVQDLPTEKQRNVSLQSGGEFWERVGYLERIFKVLVGEV